jgi:hypothetical protein
MKNKYVFFMIACITFVITLLIILYTCEFFPTTSDSHEQAPVRNEIPEQIPALKPENIEQASNPQTDVKAASSVPKEENTILIEAIKSKHIRDTMWIGLSDHEQERRWKWITGEKRIFTYWDTKQPNNLSGEGRTEDFAQIWISNPWVQIPYHWNDASAITTALLFWKEK